MTIRTRRVAGLCLALAVLALAPVLCAPVLGAQQSALEQKLKVIVVINKIDPDEEV